MGSGLPVVAIHDNGVDHRLLLSLDDALAEAGGLERWYVDLPGFGSTPALAGRGGLPDLADWLVAQVRSLVADRPCALLANSLGGLLARHVRAELADQVVGLALIAPVVQPDISRRTLPESAVCERDDALLAELDDADRREFTALAARQTQATWRLFQTYALSGIRAADQAAMQRLGAHYALDADPDTRAGEFTGPALVLTGRQDHVVGYQDQLGLVRAWYPHATYAALDGAGHNVHLDRPEVCHALLRQWATDLPR